MFLSPTDRIRFKILYMEHTHAEMAIIFNCTDDKVRERAKKLNVFEFDYIKIRRRHKKTTP